MTQTEMVLVYMARIADLKKRGHIINSEMIAVRKANGTTAKVACYSIGGER